MSIAKTILDVKNAKRSLALRAETDPAKVVQILESVMRDAVVAQASGSRTFQKKSLDELTQIRKDLVAGQVKAGAATGPMVGIYSNLLDQMNSIQSQNKKSAKNSDDAFKHLSNSIPSADTFISALMTANPLIGYGVKISRDIYRSSKAFSQGRAKEASERMAMLKKQEEYIAQQLKTVKIDEKASEEKLKENKEPLKSKKTPTEKASETKVYEAMLEKIRAEIEKVHDEIVNLKDIGTKTNNIIATAKSPIVMEGTQQKTAPKLVGRAPNGRFVKLDDIPKENQQQAEIKVDEKTSEKMVEAIEKVNESILEQTKQDKELSIDEIETQQKQKHLDERNKKLKDFSGDKKNQLDPKPIDGLVKKETGGFGKILEGLIAPIMMVLRGGLVAFGVTVGAFLLEFIAIPLMIGTAIYKFLDGFFNAEEIIGKETADITWLDRVKAGVANIFGVISKLFNWILKLFGHEGFDTKDIEKKIYKVFDNVQDYLVGAYKDSLKYAQDKYDSLTKTVTNFVDDIYGMVDSVAKFISDKYAELTGFFDKLANKGVIETFKELVMGDSSTGTTGTGGAVQPEGYTYNGDVPIPPTGPTRVAPVPNQGIRYQGDVPVPYTESIGDVPLPTPPAVTQVPNPTNNLQFKQNKSQELSDSFKKAEIEAEKKRAPAAPPVIVAPSQNDNSINNHNYMGGPSTSNPDSSFREMRNSNRTVF